jgi:PAS domain S-box-containing protein
MEIPDQDDVQNRLAVESALIATVLVNREGKIVLVDAQTEKLFGYRRQELLGQPVEILVLESSRGSYSGSRADFLAYPQARVKDRRGKFHFARRRFALLSIT